MTAVLSLSGAALNCEEVAVLMQKLGIGGDVTRNVTVLDGALEPGCRVTVVAPAPARDASKVLWEAARARFGLRCAHVEVTSHASGCVFDVFRPSACPGP